ncbi:MAG: hypothetical protein DK306_002016 [Chloroflexi bacterium]|jgi:hypothetical protein|nr:MAG: hypothetical protein DK306_002016 [Chloroflexota bacterium]
MTNWKKTLLLPALGVAVMFAALASTAAAAETGAVTDRPTDRITDVPPNLRTSVTDTGVVERSEGHPLRCAASAT